MKIAGHKFKFLKLKQSLFNFGLIHKNTITYSDPEKTILDFIYMWCYNGTSKDQIIADVADWITNISIDKLIKYAKNYPKTVQEIAYKIANNNQNRVIA
jgi:predicted transcriptional regulator